MIKIKEVTSAKERHYTFCLSETMKRLDFFLCFFNSVLDHKKQKKESSFKRTFNVDVRSLNVLASIAFEGDSNLKNSELFECFLFKGNREFLKESFFQESKQINKFLIRVRDEFDSIILSDPISLYENYCNENSIKEQACFKLWIDQIFQYERLCKGSSKDASWGTYELTKLLNVQVCPYCNKNWINTVFTEERKITNPQIDHFFPKKKFPLLQLSFYNLIPSCETCNSRVKRDTVLSISSYLHPYLDCLDAIGKFSASAMDYDSVIGLNNDYELSVNCVSDSDQKKAEKSFDFFRIMEIYKEHGDLISEIYFKKHIYGSSYLRSLADLDWIKNGSNLDSYRVLFGNYLETSDLGKRPFSKLTKDIVEQLGFFYD